MVTLQGPRQCGKSTLTREWVTQWVKGSSYRTLDRLSDQEFARDNPESFLAQSEKAPLQIVDEAQKAPPLFDAIKAQVDENPRPGQFLLLGSTEFSRETQIRENLTGRISRQRLFTLTGAEAIQALTALATVDEPTVASVAGKLRKEGRRIKRLFGFLEQLLSFTASIPTRFQLENRIIISATWHFARFWARPSNGRSKLVPPRTTGTTRLRPEALFSENMTRRSRNPSSANASATRALR